MHRIHLGGRERSPLCMLLAAIALASALVVAGTAAASRSANGVAEAKRSVAQQSKPVTWKAPGPAVDVGTQLKGKTVFFLANGLNFPFVQDMLRGVKQAAAALGMKVTTGDGAGSSAKAGQLVDQA